MPDESCRKCGNKLQNHLKCSSCNIVIQEICFECEQKTLLRFHGCNTEISITS